MIVDVLRQVTDWLNHPTLGVSAVVAGVPRDVGDTAPPAVTAYDETRQAWVATGMIPRDKVSATALLLVRSEGEVSLPPLYPDGPAGLPEVTVAVTYVASVTATPDVLWTHAYQTLRAAHRVLCDRYNVAPGAAPTRNGVLLEAPSRVTLTPIGARQDAGDTVVAALLVTFPVHDGWTRDTL